MNEHILTSFIYISSTALFSPIFQGEPVNMLEQGVLYLMLMDRELYS